MNTPPKPPLHISARHLGPIFKLDAELSKNKQNIIYARNGIGKSFLSRALRCLDLYPQHGESTPGSEIVSDESPDSTGSLEFRIGNNTLGTLEMNRECKTVTAKINSCIFHVFSNEFVQEELAENAFSPSGDFNHRIVVGVENIQLDGLKKQLSEISESIDSYSKELDDTLNREIESQIAEKAKVNSNLAERRALTLEKLLADFVEKPNLLDHSFSHYLSQLDNINRIPSDLEEHKTVSQLDMSSINLPDIKESLLCETQKTDVPDSIRNIIDSCDEFYRLGTNLLNDRHDAQCPFCRQSLKAEETMKIINAYIQYFNDEEERHRLNLSHFEKNVEGVLENVNVMEREFGKQTKQFENNKIYLPSFKDQKLTPLDEYSGTIKAALDEILDCIKRKRNALNSPIRLENCGNFSTLGEISNDVISKNNNKLERLLLKLSETDEERRNIQRKACTTFFQEFAVRHWDSINQIHLLKREFRDINSEIRALQKAGPSEFSRHRVAETFHNLLQTFFPDKYTFDESRFVIQRKQSDMKRGVDRTLSDGEKTTVAFCYFLACIHKKVKSGADYSNLFLVFDDPVTSLSHDFIYTIAHALKYVRIDDRGTVSWSGSKNNRGIHPNLLILTHNSYFLNLSLSNHVVKHDAAFVLYNEEKEHRVEPMRHFVAPFQEHLRDVFRVVHEGMKPTHTIGLSIRFVIESVGRFCWPSSGDSFSSYISHFSSDAEGLEFKSLLILSMCHGSADHETPTEDDIILACKETLKVVERYTQGQVLVLKQCVSSKQKRHQTP